MPGMQAMVADLNTAFNVTNIGTIDRKMLLSRDALLEAAHSTIAQDSAYFAYLKNWPVGQMEAIRTMLLYAVDHAPQLPVTIAWTPAYDYTLQIWDVAGTPQSLGGVTILIGSPEPPGGKLR